MVFGRNRSPAPTKAPSSPTRSAAVWRDEGWGQPLPAPDVREGGESLWEAWNDESRRMDLAFAETQPSDAIPLADSLPARLVEQAPAGPRTVDQVVALARHNGRVCPRLPLWSAVYVLVEGDRHSDLRPPPSRAIWPSLSNMHRRLQFREHIEWAERHGKLDLLASYIASLAEPDWVHMGED